MIMMINHSAGKFAANKDKKFDKRDGRDDGDRFGKSRKDRPARSDEPRVYKAEAKATDNPFTVLQQLKSK